MKLQQHVVVITRNAEGKTLESLESNGEQALATAQDFLSQRSAEMKTVAVDAVSTRTS